MKNGNISNVAGKTIGFRVEEFLLHKRKNKLTSFLMGDYYKADIDPLVYKVIEHLYRDTEFNVDLIVNESNYKEYLKDFLYDNIPFSRIVLVRNPIVDVRLRLNTNDLTYYVSYDDEISLIGKNALSVNQLNNVMKIRGDI